MTRRHQKKTSDTSDIGQLFAGHLKKLLANKKIEHFLELKWPLALVVSLLMGLLASPQISLFAKQYREGEYVERAIKARRAVVLEDIRSTEARRASALREALPVYDIDSTLSGRQKKLTGNAFDRLRLYLGLSEMQGSTEGIGQVNLVSKSDIAQAQAAFVATLGLSSLSKADFSFIARVGFSEKVQAEVEGIIDEAADVRIVADVNALESRMEAMPDGFKSFIVRDVADKNEIVLSDLEIVKDMAAFAKSLAEQYIDADKGEKRIGAIARAIAVEIIAPNTSINIAETDKRRNQAESAVLPSMIKYAKNQVIVPVDEIITKEKLSILNQITEQSSGTDNVLSFLSMAALGFLMMVAVFHFAELNIRKFVLNNRDYFFLCFFIIFVTMIIRLGFYLSTVFSEAFGFIPESAWLYLLPMAAGGMLVRILLNSEIAMVFIILISFFAGLLVGWEGGFAIFVLVGSFVATHFVRHVSRRNQIMKAGLMAGLANAAMALCITALFRSNVISSETLFNVMGGFFGGIFCGLVTLALLPLIEIVFGYSSNITLLELVSLNHPLLKDMIVRAPGTYNHSSQVSNLAEAGAEAINANSLLAKVSGLYHDIGKLNKPQYFSENQPAGAIQRQKLHPSMSSLIYMAHVREGVEMAKRFRLGDRIIQIIREHHGTCIIRKYFEAAKKMENPKNSVVSESEYRYPGPRPRTREAALVMLADHVETGARNLSNPTPLRLEQHIRECLSEMYLDDQLSECDLALVDLRQISKAFLKVITGIYHSRIEYPDAVDANEPKKELKIVEYPDS